MPKNSIFISLLCMAVTLISAPSLSPASLSVAPVFSDHMVLQRGMELPIWGSADPGSEIHLRFGNQKRTSKANSDGQWRVNLNAMKASSKPRVMTVSSESEKVSIRDVLVGEVWLCAGQSNMQFTLSKSTNGEAEVAAANHPLVRLNTAKGWNPTSPDSVPRFSAVAYFFGRKLHKETGVPVGLIARALGGTPVEWWTPLDKLERVPFAKAAIEHPSPKWVAYDQTVAEWKKVVDAEGRKLAGKKPEAPGSGEEQVLASIYAVGMPGSLYAQHFESMAGFGIRGAIWYQGERNSKAGVEASKAYRPLLANMITSWREEWGQGEFPFIAVQLPVFSKGGPGWAVIQESQAAAVSDVPNAGYIDIRDQPGDGLHPKNKKPIGERLAERALAEYIK
ncbi:sialate O-acetylesterase [Opitutia bacterium ISCC 51]|nr:sialate O-acetylesterase [Opitutae bacterium ISCC 51]QXD27689.1 sialate O-acetylesterase [Opitutae bacterium ISCC 52]